MESKEKILACLNILKRLPPTQIQKNAAALASLIPDYAEELYQKIDKPLDIGQDEKGNQFIQSEFNRDGDSFRSHVTNSYYPPIDDAVYPSEALRKLELKANAVFDEYRRLYYEGGLSSCYFWDKEDGGFATAWLIRKNVEKTKGIEDGSWSSINVIDIKTDGKSKWTYKITTSVVLEMNIIQNQDVGKFNITGTLTKQKEESFEAPAGNKDLELFHIMKIGTLVEDVESYLRAQLDGVYFGKTKDIVFQTRFLEGEKHFIQQRLGLAGEFKQKYG
ncbi:unnamed protein product [Paramecium octaurelia]|uniref:F-actin-capping protein subunit beta n=1 Tax=Paramecium octaurelia TaxID=43137 RepID=A0A8S1UVG7_PAROT|nr:unnamed protein product [Paramecium octaurelia]